MKLVPILTAILVSVALYLGVFERDRLLEFAQTSSPVTAPADTEAGDAPDTDTAAASGTAEDAPSVEADGGVIRVVATHSTAQTIDSAVILRGRTEAARQVTVAAETSGLVVSEPLRKGAYVEADQELCSLDPGTREASLAEARARLAEAEGRVPEAQAAIAEANARIREAEVNVNAARQLSEGGFASETRLVSAEAVAEAAAAGLQRAQSGVASAQAGIEAAAAGVAAAEREIERLIVRAPFAGLLETDTAELGTLMQPGAACATIIQLDPIKLVGFVPEADVQKVTVGSPAAARLTGGQELSGRVTFLSRSADETTRTFRVEVQVPNDDLTVRDGQTVEMIVASDGRRAHLLPQSALTLNDEGALGVRTIGPDNASVFMPVTLLRDTVDGVWLTDLPDTVDVILIGQEYVVDGVVVVPTFEEAKG
ncbi:efflux RND transporter periplasmic adaptor subunit [Yoonia sp. 208BN28-4]|uniref:efflux RND transporter periplasmic adaptor subunit n=1 Tax=Yoonia sp. 208BN28-4 TaxID=3126505 RepID=UPI003097EF2F